MVPQVLKATLGDYWHINKWHDQQQTVWQHHNMNGLKQHQQQNWLYCTISTNFLVAGSGGVAVVGATNGPNCVRFGICFLANTPSSATFHHQHPHYEQHMDNGVTDLPSIRNQTMNQVRGPNRWFFLAGVVRKVNKNLRQWDWHISTCRSYVNTPRDFTNGASLAWRLHRRISTAMFTCKWVSPARSPIGPILGF